MGRKIQLYGPKNRQVRYTCSPGLVRKYLKHLSPQQKDYVRKIGFGSFLSMADFELDKDLTLWLLQRFNCKTESLEFGGGISVPVRPLVKSVLGIPSGPIPVVGQLDVDPAQYDRYYKGNNYPGNERYTLFDRCGRTIVKKSKSIHSAGPQICSETEENHFCIAFIMALLAIYLAPDKNPVTSKHFFGAACQVNKLSQMDWCNFTTSYLFEGIKEFKQSNKAILKVKGCVHILSEEYSNCTDVIFIDLVKNIKIPGGFPRIGIVTTQHKELVTLCSHPFEDYQVHRIEESVYASALKILENSIFEGRKCAASDANTDARADQFGTTVEDTTCNNIELMETHHSLPTTRSRKEPEGPLENGRSTHGTSQKHLRSAELVTGISSPNTASLPTVEPLELDSSALSAESASPEDSHTRQESLIIDANADRKHHHSVEQEHINFLRVGQQSQSNGPSSEPYASQITEGLQVAPDISLGRNRPSPSTMEEGDWSSKRARVEQPSGYVEPAGGGAIVDTSLLNCPLCSHPFKPPVFQCKGGHLACGTCAAELPGIQCQKCKHGGAFDVHNIVLSAKVKCSHDGCQSYVRYHELDDHQSTCPCAPCFCTEPGCSFVGLPVALLSHLTTLHSWPVHCIEYGKELRLQVPVSEPWHLLLGEEDGCVFLLAVGAVGQSTATAVSVVRLGACPTHEPRYMVNILAYLPPAAASRRAHMLLLDMEVDSSTTPGEVAVEKLPSYLTVPPTYLVGAEASKEVSLDMRIDKIVS